jgi:hypothetical protein
MMNAGEMKIKERILMTMQEYSVLKERIKDDECGWSYLFLWRERSATSKKRKQQP